MSSLITSSIYNCDEYVIGGIKKLYITNNSSISAITFSSSDLTNTTVTNFVPFAPASNITWYQYSITPGATFYTGENNITPNGFLISKSFSIQFNKLTPAKRSTLLEHIRAWNNITIAFQDSTADQWWVIGEEPGFGLRVSKYLETTGTSEDDNKVDVTFSLTSRYPVRAISNSYIVQ